jgi:hypothetical protein
MRIKRAIIAAAGIGLGLLGGCAGIQVDEHSYQFNEATGSLGLRLLLLNAVRASKDYPLQFSKINAYQGTGTMGTSVSATMPMQLFPGNGTVTPKVDWKDGVSQLNLIDLNTEEAQQALRKVVSYKLYDYYANFHGSKSLSVIDAIMFEYVKVPRGLYELIVWRTGGICKDARTKNEADQRQSRLTFACEQLDVLRKGCDDFFGPRSVFPNDLTSRCSFNAFLAASLRFDILGVAPVPPLPKKQREQPSSIRKAGGDTFNIYVAEQKGGEDKAGSDEHADFWVSDKIFSDKCIRTEYCQPALNRKTLRPVPHTVKFTNAKFQFRSPERMVRYLGELIAAQHYRPQRFVPEIVDPVLQERFALFRVEHGVPLPGSAAVAIRDPDGEMFYVPRPQYGQPGADRSLEALAFVSDVLNQAVSKKAFPQVTTFTVSPSP